MGCIQRDELERFLAGELNVAAAANVAAHVEECAACERVLAALAGSQPPLLQPGPAIDADATTGEPASGFLDHLRSCLSPTSGLLRAHGLATADWQPFQAPEKPAGAAEDPSTGGTPAAVPGYEILAELSRGGMGVIYKARQVALNRVVALKMILTVAHAGRERRARFRTEAEAVARLQHPNIVQIYDVGEHDGCPYFSMELIDGPTLTEACRGQPQPPAAAAALVEVLARAMHCAHLQGIIHRDLKPDNVMLASGGREPPDLASGGLRPPLAAAPKIIDFGLAKLEGDVKLTQQGQILGTPSYMAPEQVSGKGAEVGPATDVYALGTVLYELLTGRPPFLADSVQSTLTLVTREEPIPLRRLQPKTPRDLETICLKCLEKSPARRYAQAVDLAEDLRRFQAHESIAARPPSAWDRGTKFVRRNRHLVAGLAGTLAAMLVGTIVSVLFALGESRQRRVADDNAHHMEEARRRADDNAHHMEEARRRADDNAAKAQWEAYQGRTAVAQSRLLEHSPREAAEQLDKAPADLRRWEWFHLHSRLDDSMAVLGEPNNPFAALFPTSSHVVLSSTDQQLSLWDADNTCLKQLAAGRVLAVVSSPARSLLFVERRGSGDVVAFDDSGRPGPSFDIPGPVYLFAAALSTDGKQLAAAWTNANRDTHTLALFDAATGALSSPLSGPQSGEIVALAFSADGTHLVAGRWPRYLELWDVPAHRLLAAWPHSGTPVTFSPDGRHILSIADGSCYLWDVPTGKQLPFRGGAEDRVAAATYSPDGKRIATGGKAGVLRILSAATGEVVAEFHGHNDAILTVAYSPDGKSIATGGKDRVLRLFSAATGEVVAEFHGHNDAIGYVAYSPDGQSVWTVGDGTARCWDAAIQGDPRVLPHMSYVYSVAYSPDGRWFATAGWHDSDGGASDIYLWDAASSQPIAVLHGCTSWIAALAITPDGKQIVALANDESVRVWDATTGRGRKLPFTAARLDAPHGHRISISPDGRLLAVGEGQRVRLWDLQSDIEQAALPLSLTGVRIAVFSPDGTRLAVAGGQPEVQIVAVPTGEVLTVLRGHTGVVNSVSFSPDGKRVLTASQDRSVRLWDAATGELQTVLGGARGGHTDTVFTAVFHPDGTRIATGGRDRAIRIWDTATGDELVRLAGHTDYVFTLAFSPDGATLLSGSGDGSVRLWDTAPLRERQKARRQLEALRPEADALVDRLFHEGFDADEVVQRLRTDTDLSEPLRRAAWHAVLRRADGP